jgi:hypothetical protein
MMSGSFGLLQTMLLERPPSRLMAVSAKSAPSLLSVRPSTTTNNNLDCSTYIGHCNRYTYTAINMEPIETTVRGDVLETIPVSINTLLERNPLTVKVYGLIRPMRTYPFTRTRDGRYVVTPDIVILHEPDGRIVLGVHMSLFQVEEASKVKGLCSLVPMSGVDRATVGCYSTRYRQMYSGRDSYPLFSWLKEYRLVKIVYTARDQPTYGELDEVYGITQALSIERPVYGYGTDVIPSIVREIGRRRAPLRQRAQLTGRVRERERQEGYEAFRAYVKWLLEPCLSAIKEEANDVEKEIADLELEKANRLKAPEYVELAGLVDELTEELYRTGDQELAAMLRWRKRELEQLRKALAGDIDERIDELSKVHSELTSRVESTVSGASSNAWQRVLFLLRTEDKLSFDELPAHIVDDIRREVLSHCQ